MIKMITKRVCINNEPTRYLVNENGQIYSEIRKRFLKPYLNPNGYYLIDINHRGIAYTRQVHRLVALAFIPNPNRLETVNHKDGNKANNTVYNLEWMTRLDNVRHAWETGLVKPRYGTDNPACVYTEEQIHQVCQMLEVGDISNKCIALTVGVNVSLIRDIKFRGKWKQISDLYDIPKLSHRRSPIRDAIIELINKGYDDDEIMAELKLTDKRKIKYARIQYEAASTTIPE